MAEQTAYDELVTAVNRFLAGSYNVAYLMGWCHAHFQPPEDATEDDPAIQLWKFVMLNLRVYARCDSSAGRSTTACACSCSHSKTKATAA